MFTACHLFLDRGSRAAGLVVHETYTGFSILFELTLMSCAHVRLFVK